MWWDILSNVGGVQYREGYHKYRGGYLEYRGGYHDARGGYHEYHGVFSTMEERIFCYLSTPTVLNTSDGTHDIPHVHHDTPTVLSILHGTQGNSPRYCIHVIQGGEAPVKRWAPIVAMSCYINEIFYKIFTGYKSTEA